MIYTLFTDILLLLVAVELVLIGIVIGQGQPYGVTRMNTENTSCKPEPRQHRPERSLPKVGNDISWATLGGQTYRGRVVEMDSNVARVLCDDGVKRCVEC